MLFFPAKLYRVHKLSPARGKLGTMHTIPFRRGYSYRGNMRASQVPTQFMRGISLVVE